MSTMGKWWCMLCRLPLDPPGGLGCAHAEPQLIEPPLVFLQRGAEVPGWHPFYDERKAVWAELPPGEAPGAVGPEAAAAQRAPVQAATAVSIPRSPDKSKTRVIGGAGSAGGKGAQ